MQIIPTTGLVKSAANFIFVFHHELHVLLDHCQTASLRIRERHAPRSEYRVVISSRNNDSEEVVPRDRLGRCLRQRGGSGGGGNGDANKLTVVSISRLALYFLGVSYRSSGVQRIYFYSSPPTGRTRHLRSPSHP